MVLGSFHCAARGVGGIWAGNLWYDFSGRPPEFDGLVWDKWRTCGKETGGAYADPLFANAAANDFRLTSGSPAFALGFEAWDYSAAGPNDNDAGQTAADGWKKLVPSRRRLFMLKYARWRK